VFGQMGGVGPSAASAYEAPSSTPQAIRLLRGYRIDAVADITEVVQAIQQAVEFRKSG
jgi:hypothetical protein